MAFALHNIQPILSQGPKICVKKKSWCPPDGCPKHVTAKWNPRQSIYIIDQACRKKRVKLTEQNDFPAFRFYGWFQRLQRPAFRQLFSQPSLRKPTTGHERDRCA